MYIDHVQLLPSEVRYKASTSVEVIWEIGIMYVTREGTATHSPTRSQ